MAVGGEEHPRPFRVASRGGDGAVRRSAPPSSTAPPPRPPSARPGSTRRARQSRRFVNSPDWLRLPLTGYPDFATWQPFLDEIITHPAPDAFRARHNFRRTIDIPGFHVTSWFDIFQTSVIAAFQEIQARTGTQKLWVGPNEHYFVYASNFWPRDPYFEWFGHWLKGEPSALVDEPAVYLFAARLGRRPRRLCAERLGPRRALAAARTSRRAGFICAATAVSARRRPARRAAIATTRAGRSRASAGATC